MASSFSSGTSISGREQSAGVVAEGFAEVVEVGGLELQARGHLVPAVGFQVIAAGFQGVGEVEAGDRSAAALAVAVVERDHDGRAVEAVDDARGDDADHARVPAFGAEDDAAAVVGVVAVARSPAAGRLSRIFLSIAWRWRFCSSR